MENKKRHVQVPNDMTSTHIISPKDLVIYATIKKYANEKGMAFPSLRRISEDSGASINTIRNCINTLEKEDYIEIDKSGKNNIYYCKKYEKFEPFSYEFLNKKDLTFTEKAYLLASQQYMIKENDEGKMTYSNINLSQKINMPESTIRKCDKSLQEKEYLTILNVKTRDPETGCLVKEKIYHLTKLEQAIVFILKQHNEQINKNTTDIEDLKKENESLKKDNTILKNSMEEISKKVQKLETCIMN